ncbi:MAG: hypothetical protein K6C34_01220 [Alphaproteobacteria bacterium]|nr:hypothetical protein [Alphaproteobacteria bacterium]
MKKVIFLSMMVTLTMYSVDAVSVGRKLLAENQGNVSQVHPLKTSTKDELAEMRSTLDKVIEKNKRLESRVNEAAEKSAETEKQLKNLTAFTGKFYEGTGQLFSCLLNKDPQSQRTEQIDTDSALSRALTIFSSTKHDGEGSAEPSELPIVPAKKRKKAGDALDNALMLFLQSNQPIIEEPQDE